MIYGKGFKSNSKKIEKFEVASQNFCPEETNLIAQPKNVEDACGKEENTPKMEILEFSEASIIRLNSTEKLT
jgi:hypothetical protein